MPRNYVSAHFTADFRDVFSEKQIPVLIVWTYGGRPVAISGSWDNWNRRDQVKILFWLRCFIPVFYHYRFVVDERLKYATDLPLEFDGWGMAYSILDMLEHAPEAPPDSLSEFETPSSPSSSYNNEPLTDDELSKLPPDMPPQLQLAPPQLKSTLPYEGSPAMDGCGLLPRHQHEMLNHLYIQRRDHSSCNNSSSDRSHVALASTHRFHQK